MAIRGLSIYLLKETITDPSACINFDAVSELEAFSRLGLEPWYLAIRHGEEKYPDWAYFLADLVNIDLIGKTRSIGALLLIPSMGRWFGLTFGTGRYLLLPDTLEERFGLRATLNSLDEEKLRSIDKKTFEAVPLHAREQASEDSGTAAFGLDVERDLLRAVTGTPNSTELGTRLAGMDSLKAHIEVELQDLETVLARYYQKYLDTSYREKFPWVDHISEVNDKTMTNELDKKVIERIRTKDYKRCWLACPEIVDWADVRGFRYGQARKYVEYHDLRLPQFMNSVSPHEAVDLEILTRHRVFCIRDDDRIMKDWSIYEYLNCEVDHEGKVFLLSSGRWYRIDQDFVGRVNDFVDHIPSFDKPLPIFEDGNEAAYNARVAASAPGTYALMDRDMIKYGGGPSKIEFCDLFTTNRDLIHVKQYGGSSPLSHLFSQGLNSADLFLGEVDFRQIVHGKLPQSHRFFDPLERPRPETYQVVFAIISESKGPLWLPFFSRLSLRHACKRLGTLGYRVALTKIDVADSIATGLYRGPTRKTF